MVFEFFIMYDQMKGLKKRKRISLINQRNKKRNTEREVYSLFLLKASSSSSFSRSDSSLRSSRSHSKYDYFINLYFCRIKKKHTSFLKNEENWKCKFCYNINFRHRKECNRCRRSR